MGFPGETDADFEATLDVVRAARFAGAFTFQYSRRPGTAAASMPAAVPPEVVAERYQRLVAVQEDISWELNRGLVGREVELLVSEGEGRKDAATARMSGRARDGRLVHFTPAGPAVDRAVRPGDLVRAVVSYGAPHHLVADGPLLAHRRTPAGDHHEAGVRPGGSPVQLGLPAVGRPVEEAPSAGRPAESGCAARAAV